MVNKYILIWCGNEMSFVRMLTLGIHISTDAHWYSRLVIILPTYFWRLTLLYNVSAEANCFLRFIIIKFVISLATQNLRINFCWNWTRPLFSDMKVGAYLHVCVHNEPKVTAHVFRRSELCSLLSTIYLILICCATIHLSSIFTSITFTKSFYSLLK